MAPTLFPEFFLFLGVDFFVALSLITCLMNDFRRPIPYLFQAAAVFGYLNLLMSREFLSTFGEFMRFSYCFLYLALALMAIIGINIYFVVSKRSWGKAKVWASVVTFPTVLMSAFFISLYASEMLHVVTAAVLSSAMLLAMGIAFLVLPEETRDRLLRR